MSLTDWKIEIIDTEKSTRLVAVRLINLKTGETLSPNPVMPVGADDTWLDAALTEAVKKADAALTDPFLEIPIGVYELKSAKADVAAEAVTQP